MCDIIYPDSILTFSDVAHSLNLTLPDHIHNQESLLPTTIQVSQPMLELNPQSLLKAPICCRHFEPITFQYISPLLFLISMNGIIKSLLVFQVNNLGGIFCSLSLHILSVQVLLRLPPNISKTCQFASFSLPLSFSDKSLPFSQFSSVTQSCPTLRPHEPQHARPHCPSQTPRVHPNPCPSSR